MSPRLVMSLVGFATLLSACGEDRPRRFSTPMGRMDAGVATELDAGAQTAAVGPGCVEDDEPLPLSCCGGANVEAPVRATTAGSWPERGLIYLMLHDLPDGAIRDGDRVWMLTIPAASGQLTYRAGTESLLCYPMEYVRGILDPVGDVSACEVVLSELRFAVNNGECDGRIAGELHVTIDGATVSGTFDVALAFTEAELMPD